MIVKLVMTLMRVQVKSKSVVLQWVYSFAITADCEWKAQAGNICVASFDWSCSGICRSADRIKEVHRRCGEGEKALWSATF